jgi:hypothetical protein
MSIPFKVLQYLPSVYHVLQRIISAVATFVGASVMTTQQNLVEVDASWYAFRLDIPQRYLMYLLARVSRSYRRCGHSQHDHWLLPGDRYIPVLRSEVVTTCAVHCC